MPFGTDRSSLFQYVNQAIGVMETMDECVVTKNAVAIIKRTLDRATKLENHSTHYSARVNYTRGSEIDWLGSAISGESNLFAGMQPFPLVPTGTDCNQTLGEPFAWLDAGSLDQGEGLIWAE